MGYVFTLDELTRGMVPTKHDYDKAKIVLRDDLLGLQRKGLVQGAMFFGSTTNHGWGIGSDIDILVAFDSSRLNDLYRFLKLPPKVPVEIVPLQTDLSVKGIHDMPRHFVEYLKTVEPDMREEIGTTPTALIAYPDDYTSYRDGIAEEAKSKLIKLAKRRLNGARYSREHMDLLERLMRWPSYVARGALQFRFGRMPDSILNQPTRHAIYEAYAEEFPDSYVEILRKANENTEIYRSLVGSSPSIKEYISILDAIGATLPQVHELLKYHVDIYNKGAS